MIYDLPLYRNSRGEYSISMVACSFARCAQTTWRTRFLEGTFLEACKCNKSLRATITFMTPATPWMYRAMHNLSRESRRSATVMCSSQPYQLLAKKPWELRLFQLKKHSRYPVTAKSRIRLLERITPRRFIRHSDLMRVLFPIPLVPSIYPLNRRACSRM